MLGDGRRIDQFYIDEKTMQPKFLSRQEVSIPFQKINDKKL